MKIFEAMDILSKMSAGANLFLVPGGNYNWIPMDIIEYHDDEDVTMGSSYDLTKIEDFDDEDEE